MIAAQKAQVVGLADEFSKLAAERNVWKGRASDYRTMVLGCLSKMSGGYVRFRKDFQKPGIDYNISIKEDETTVRLKIIEKRAPKIADHDELAKKRKEKKDKVH